MNLLRYISFPLVPFYYLATWLRNKFYDWGIKSSTSFEVPIICIGNLSVGGTGKTPMIEYIIRLLKNDHKIATLNRGYKRKTKGFIIADKTVNAEIIGDEPFQFYKKFNDIIVSVDTNRRNGIEQLLSLENKPDVILLDDAFQHRRVKAGFNVMLTQYDNLYVNDMVLPTGNLREPKLGANRADVIVVTKCPNSISAQNKQKIIESLNPLQNQQVFFSSIRYSETIRNSFDKIDRHKLKDKSFTLVTGIANSKPLVEFFLSEGLHFEHLKFRDHYEFSEKDVENFRAKELIVTTEKDFMRLEPYFKDSGQLFYLPIETVISEAKIFDNLITKFIANF